MIPSCTALINFLFFCLACAAVRAGDDGGQTAETATAGLLRGSGSPSKRDAPEPTVQWQALEVDYAHPLFAAVRDRIGMNDVSNNKTVADTMILGTFQAWMDWLKRHPSEQEQQQQQDVTVEESRQLI